MRFNSNNQPDPANRRPRGAGKRSSALKAIRSRFDGEETEFYEELIKYAFGDGEKIKPNAQLMLAILQRVEPPIKSSMPLVNFKLNPKLSPLETINQINKLVAEGKLPIDYGSMFISNIKETIKIDEYVNVKNDVEEIKAELKRRGDS